MSSRQQSINGISVPSTSSGDLGDPGAPVSASPKRTRTRPRKWGMLLALGKILCYTFLAGIIALASVAIHHLHDVPWSVNGILSANEFDVITILTHDVVGASVGAFTDALEPVTDRYGRFLEACGYLWYFLIFALFVGLGLSAITLLVDLLHLSFEAWRKGEEEWLYPPWFVFKKESRSPTAEIVIECGLGLYGTWSFLTIFLFVVFSCHKAVHHWAEGREWDIMSIFGWQSNSIGVTLLAIVVNLTLVLILVVHFIKIYSEISTS